MPFCQHGASPHPPNPHPPNPQPPTPKSQPPHPTPHAPHPTPETPHRTHHPPPTHPTQPPPHPTPHQRLPACARIRRFGSFLPRRHGWTETESFAVPRCGQLAPCLQPKVRVYCPDEHGSAFLLELIPLVGLLLKGTP